jgi:RNA polymerase sigma-70 factor (family 1)
VADQNQHEQHLLFALSQSDELAFAEIYKTYWKLLHDTAFRRLGDEDQAKDIVQDIFVKLWDKRADLSIDNLKAYLQTAARYHVYNLIAREKVNETYFKYLASFETALGAADQNVLYLELQERFGSILNRMPAKRREVFELRYDDGLSTHDIAEKLNITQKTVQNQLIKAVDSVKEAILMLIILLAFLYK